MNSDNHILAPKTTINLYMDREEAMFLQEFILDILEFEEDRDADPKLRAIVKKLSAQIERKT